jgi:Uma2 family endonuclease
MAVALTLTHPVTDEELLALSQRNPGYQFERNAAGALIVTPTGSKSGRREGKLFVQLDEWAEHDGSGLAFGPSAGFRCPDGAVRSPDASWVQRERWDTLTSAQQEGFAPLCPDVVFEVVSPSDDLEDLKEKMAAYLGNGARLGVLIVPENRQVWIYRFNMHPVTLTAPDLVDLDPELPEFVLRLGPIFSP